MHKSGQNTSTYGLYGDSIWQCAASMWAGSHGSPTVVVLVVLVAVVLVNVDEVSVVICT